MADSDERAAGDEHHGGKIKIEVRTTDGEHAEFHERSSETVGALKAKAITTLGIRPAPGVQYFLFLGGKRLADEATLQAAGVKDGTVLMLASEPQVGVAG